MLKPISTRIDDKTFAAFDKVCRETHIPKSRLICEGLTYVVEKYSDLNKKLDLIHAIEEAEADVKTGRVHTLKEVDEMLGYTAKKRRKH